MICGFLFMLTWAGLTVWGIYYLLERDERKQLEKENSKPNETAE